MIARAYDFALSDAERERVEGIARLAAEGARGVPELVAMLTDPSWAVRRRAIGALAGLGDVAVQPLCDVLLSARDNETRISAAMDALAASTGDVEATVHRLLESDNLAVVADTVQMLGRRRTTSVAMLADLVRHPDDNVAVAAIEGLGRIGGRAAVDVLVAAIESGNFFRTYPAIDVLGRSGDPRAIAPLAALVDKPPYAPEAIRALGRSGDRAAVGPLAALLGRPVDATVRAAALALADLRQRHAARFGSADSVDAQLRRAVPAAGAIRRLSHALAAADAQEQIAICAVLGAIADEASLPTLTRLLDATIPAVANAAAMAMQQIGHGSDSPLLEAIRSGDSGVRRALLPLVRRSGGIAAVLRCLDDPDPSVRAAACDALARLGSEGAVRALFRCLADPHPQVQHAAAAAIQALGGSETEALASKLAVAPDRNLRRAALRILSYFGFPEALPLFLAAVTDPDPGVRESAIAGLPMFDDARAFETVCAAARHASARMRGVAMRALGKYDRGEDVGAHLLRGTEDPDPWVRYYACQSLGATRYEAGTKRVSELVSDPAGQVQVAAVEALSHMRGRDAFESLRRASESENVDVRRAAVVGLGISRQPEAAPLLLEAARNADSSIRLMAISALAAFPAAEVLAELGRATSDPDEGVRRAAMGVLAKRDSADATLLLINLARTASANGRILEALSMPSDARIRGIVAALESADDELASMLTSALARMRRRESTQALADVLATSINPAARKAAATTLAGLATPEATKYLKTAALHDPDEQVRRVCAVLLTE